MFYETELWFEQIWLNALLALRGWGPIRKSLTFESETEKALSIMTLGIMTLRLMAFSIMKVRLMTFSIMTLSIMTLSIMTLTK